MAQAAAQSIRDDVVGPSDLLHMELKISSGLENENGAKQTGHHGALGAAETNQVHRGLVVTPQLNHAALEVLAPVRQC